MGHLPVGESSAPGLDRRTALKRGMLVGGALAWTVPVVQAVSLTAAHAESPSSPPPPNNPPNENPPGNPGQPGQPGQPTGQNPPAAPPAGNAAPVPPNGSASPKPSGGEELAFTGPGLPLVPTIAVATSLIATGAAAQAAGRRRTPQPDDPDADPEQA